MGADPVTEQKPVYLDDDGNPIQSAAAAPVYLDDDGNPVGAEQTGASFADRAIESLPTIGGFVGSLAGAGKWNPLGMAGAGLGGVIGESGRQVIQSLRGRGDKVPETVGGRLSSIAKSAATESGIQGAGGVVGKALQSVGRGAYRFALRPQNKVLGKYGKEVVDEGIRRGAPVSAKGIRKIADLKGKAISDKDAKLALAGDRVSILTKPLVDDTTTALRGQADELRRAGLGDPSQAWRDQGAEIVANNPPGISPADLEAIKRTHDNQLGGAFRKIRNREPLEPPERFGVQFVDKAREAQEAITPGYKAANKEIMALSGLESALRNRVEGSAANDGLANLGLVFGGITAAPAKVASMPAVASRAGIAADRTGQAAKYGLPAAVRAALLALMDDDKKQN